MFKTYVGPVEEDAGLVYLRPETAQGIFVNFENVLQSMRKQLPVRHRADRQGVPQRDQPRQLHLSHARVRADGDAVLHPDPEQETQWYDYWREQRWQWYLDLGMKPRASSGIRTAPRSWRTTRARRWTSTIQFPFGWKEMEGIHDRTDFDLRRHAEFSGKDLTYFDDLNKRRYVPYIIETSGGADRVALAFLCDAYPRTR